MQSDVIVNVRTPHDEEDIIVPDTDSSDSNAENSTTSPNTGFLTVDGSSNPNLSNNMLVLGIMSVIIIVAITALTLITRKYHIKFILNRNKYVSRTLIALAILVSALSFVGLKTLNNTFNPVNAEGGLEQAEQGDTLSISTGNAVLSVDSEDEAVFAYTKDTVTINNSTEAGYTLTAYIDGDAKDLMNTTNEEASDAKIAGLSTLASQPLTDNTWGIAMQKPETKDSPVFHGLPTDEAEALTLNVKGAATEAGDTTDVYIGTYVTPDLPNGTYSGVTINYKATANVVTDNITVNYHGNGLYFDENETKDENTVVYSSSCEMMYVGGNCRKVYTTEEPAEIAKSPNVNDDGTQNGPYYTNEDVNYIQPVTIPGADKLRVVVDYGLTADKSELAIIEGEWDGQGAPSGAYYELYDWRDNISGTQTYVLNGDTVTLNLQAWGVPEADYDYGFYAKIYPIYNERPDGIEIIETTACNFLKSDNLDDDGVQLTPYSSEYGTKSFSIPGASKLKVELTYGLTADTGNVVVKGGSPDDSGNIYIIANSQDGNIAKTETAIINGDRLTIGYDYWDNGELVPEGYDYGFYAKIYPIYDEETGESVPEKVCSVVNKSGEYTNAFGEENSSWYLAKYNSDHSYDERLELSGEDGVKEFLSNSDEYKGKTIDLYATPNFYIHFNANGGEGEMEDQTIGYSENCGEGYYAVCDVIHENQFTRVGFSPTGWNTEPDGSGDSYRLIYPEMWDSAAPGQTINLYIQWVGSIDYIENGEDVEGNTDNQIVEDGYKYILYASNFSRDGYGFAGWSTVPDYETNPNARIYGPNESIDVPEGTKANGMLLYATWIESAGSLQSDAASVCSTLTQAPIDGTADLSSVSALTDERDGQTYAIAKLADGNCWMIENLRLEGEFTRGAANEALSEGYHTGTAYGDFIGLADAEPDYLLTGVWSSPVPTTANSLYYSGIQEGAAIVDVGATDKPGYRIPRYSNLNTKKRRNNGYNYYSYHRENGPTYSFGNRYNWAAAKASTAFHQDEAESETINTSICPAGWKLPPSGSGRSTITEGSYHNLGTKLGTFNTTSTSTKVNIWRAYPNNFIYSDTELSGLHGEYWTSATSTASAAKVSEDAKYLSIDVSSVSIPVGTKKKGSSVRCVLIP